MSRVPSHLDLMNEGSVAETVREVVETLGGRIRTALSDDITSGRLAPGAEIDEQDLAQRFGASRTPVREALRELASAGLVIIEPRRGARVVKMTAERVGELFELMAEIEAVCVRFATYRCNAVERAGISRIHAAALQAVETGDVDGYDQLNQAFHGALYAATHNWELHAHAQALRRRGAPFRRAQFRGVERLRGSWLEHGEILQVFFAGNGEDAARLMRAHMLRAGNVYMDYVEGQVAARPQPTLGASDAA